MAGGVGAPGGQSHGAGRQSKSGPHSTLKENWTSASCGSNPLSTSVTSKESSPAWVALFTRRKRYGEKSPARLTRITRVFAASASLLKYALSTAVACAG